MSLSQHPRAIVDADGNITLMGELSEGVDAFLNVDRFVDEALFEEDAFHPVIVPPRQSRSHGILEENMQMIAQDDVASVPTIEHEEMVDWTTMLMDAEAMTPNAAEDATLREVQDHATSLRNDEPSAAAVAWQDMRRRMYEVTSLAVGETTKQYATTLLEGKQLGQQTVKGLRSGLESARRFLSQPVWVPTRRNKPKQYKRGTLFALDMIRFGGTFTALFLGLFVALNYQSFWDIAKANIDPLADLKASVMAASGNGSDVGAQFKPTTLSSASRIDGDLLSFVPPVGPPQNLLVIPKLGLQVPIQNPSSQKLLTEDWSGLEQEIQSALAHGVVHYPGTARPGQAGNFFVTGHSSYFPWAEGDYKSVFARLHALEVGDEYWVFYGGDKYRYIVQDKKEVKPSDVSVLDQPVQKRISTLMTCSPVGTTLRRLIITSQEVDPTTGLALEVGEHAKRETTASTRPEMLPI